MREVTVQFRRSENGSLAGGFLLGKPLSLIADEKEEAVFAIDELGQGDRAPESCAILIAFQYVTRKAIRNIEIIVGVEIIVAQEFKRAAVPLIGSRLGDDADHARRRFVRIRQSSCFRECEIPQSCPGWD